MSKKAPSNSEPQAQLQERQQQPEPGAKHTKVVCTDAAEQGRPQQSSAGEASGQQQQLTSGISAETERLLEGLLTPAGSLHGSHRSRRGDVHLHATQTAGSANTGSDGSITSLVSVCTLHLIFSGGTG